jgi:hypothetical protein
MSGIKFLLDTNFILGLLKSQPAVLAEISERKLSIAECGYSAMAVTFAVTQRTIERWLKQLKAQALIELKGAPKTGGYHRTADNATNAKEGNHE